MRVEGRFYRQLLLFFVTLSMHHKISKRVVVGVSGQGVLEVGALLE